MEEFVRGYASALTGSSIARKRGLNQKSVANALAGMEKEGLLKSRTSGKNREFFLNIEDKEALIHFLSAIEHFRTLNLYKNNPLVKEICSKIITHCEGVAVIFGSYAKGTQKTGSDLDLFIAGKCDSKAISKVGEVYGAEIHVNRYPLNLFRKAIKTDVFLKEITNDHILINHIDAFIRAALE